MLVQKSLAVKSALFAFSVMSIAVLTFVLVAGYARAENRTKTVVSASFKSLQEDPGAITIQKTGQINDDAVQEDPAEQEIFRAKGEIDFDQWQSLDTK